MPQAPTKKICLITPGHIASNPRLVKEAQTLAKNGFSVHIIFTQFVDYIIDFDDHILKNNPTWTYDLIYRNQKKLSIQLQNFIATITQKICLILLLPAKNSGFVLAYAINRYFSWYYKKALVAKADLYIAHNLASLPVAVFAAKKMQVKCGFDAEDFHRNEVSDDISTTDVKIKAIVENKFIPKLDHFTVASPLIENAYRQLYQNNSTCVLNVFPRTKNKIEITSKQVLKLVWFSQYIGLGRGLEQVFSALNAIAVPNLELHLIGFLSPEIKAFLQKNTISTKIITHPPVHPAQLMQFISQFDIGLATEISFPFNRDICLSNKIFSYIQAGLAVIISDTQAQKQLFKSYPEIGKMYDKNSISDLTLVLKSFYADRELLLSCKKNNYALGQSQLNWETESVKFLKVVKETLVS